MSILLALVFFAMPLDADIYDRLNELPRHLRSGGIPRDGIPAMSNPIPVTPANAHYLTDADLVLGVVVALVAQMLGDPGQLLFGFLVQHFVALAGLFFRVLLVLHRSRENCPVSRSIGPVIVR